MILLERISAAFSRFAGLFAAKFLRRERPAAPMPPMLPMPFDASIVELPRLEVPAPSPPPPEPPAEPLPEDINLRQGQFYFRDTILDELGLYMRFIARMRHLDPDAYGLYSRIGARVLPKRMETPVHELEPWFAQMQPAFGCVAIGCNKREVDAEKTREGTTPRFVYFTKYASPPAAVQRTNGGTVYMVTAFFDPAEARKRMPKFGWVQQYVVKIDRAGAIVPLKIRADRLQTIRSKRRHDDTTQVVHRRWDWPPGLNEWAADHKMSPEAYQVMLFKLVANGWALTHASIIHVTATNSAGLTAAFGVDVKRTPYFFKDRDVVLTPKGKKARIFHSVRPHRRTLRDGREVPVRMHFAGLRRFHWNGYEVRISVPGLHHADLAEIHTGSIDVAPDFRMTADHMTMPQMGKWLQTHVAKGWQTLQRVGSVH